MNKEKIKELAKDNINLFGLFDLLRKEGYKVKFVTMAQGMYIKFDTPIYDDINVICSSKFANDNAEKVNESLRFEVE